MKNKFAEQQLKILEEMFEKEKWPSKEERIMISKLINVHPRRVQIWYQNKRAVSKKENERNIVSIYDFSGNNSLFQRRDEVGRYKAKKLKFLNYQPEDLEKHD